ncbi:TetR/AcrR family transcriptional regulator [Rhodococcus sp. IEGM 1370]|jgi:TetR/AcrR family transcriptional repressor of lmrAB and yxaGH operons|uniref:TetR/AcrR family transcriptional regulator n=3 Tax=Rhodococcus TaxID=1827 RepID=UPI000B9A9F4C|nr:MULTISPECIES: TetR/AcrR family transcriptional regulator [unclassified Rhodococcus (in: high G+C Gram-positive bacteria)]MDV8078686.1 TetR/AcrR family transcriptional regulator [Rhodococcus sp. IEGM 1370]OZE30416.1 TetR family transcriptional regulator [Rhodococcus sp. 05-2254-6]OZE32915.1 TetR family transcriptional regulator [Rhodococcus sp. 05-2254-4]OZE44191.1 TetR family transcriptional regulator [Rhodococcus sp. 05-2254-3]OZE56129.1 TetR family transcriptional regulator [Rhodococcus s
MARTVLERSDAVRALADVFRKRGFESGSLSVIQQETGLGRGSLYHFFPAGKTDMARAVLEQVGKWFEEQIFVPLRTTENTTSAIEAMSREVTDYFMTRESVCLFAAITLGQEKATFAEAVRNYFTDWVDALAEALQRGGLSTQEAAARALDAVATIQGGLILARAYGDHATFLRIIDRTEQRLLAPAP